jgi:hypothetical protein
VLVCVGRCFAVCLRCGVTVCAVSVGVCGCLCACGALCVVLYGRFCAVWCCGCLSGCAAGAPIRVRCGAVWCCFVYKKQ